MAQNTIEYSDITDEQYTDEQQFRRLLAAAQILQKENVELKEKLHNFKFYILYFFVILFIIQYLYFSNYYRGEILKEIEKERDTQNKNLDTIIEFIKKNSDTIIGLVNSLYRPPVLQF